MKINVKNIFHWVALIQTTTIILIASFVRIFIQRPNIVLLYGHKLNGNLKPLYESLSFTESCYFGSMDSGYLKGKELGRKKTINLCSFRSVTILSRTKVIITSHGLHSLILFKYLTKIKFVDVWHGIPFKGFDENDFSLQLTYDEIWVASDFHKKLYIEKYKFNSNKVFATGYARTDILINEKNSAYDLKIKYKIPNQKKIIAFCPTWKQDDKHRNIFPFDTEESKFLNKLNDFCSSKNISFVIRTHLNTKKQQSTAYNNLYFIDADTYPLTEEILLISDILICDWSSICFDYLLLKRPTIFLDVPVPFRKGLSIPASFRYGDIADSLDTMFHFLTEYIYDENIFYRRNLNKLEEVTAIIYGEFSDGKSSERCVNRLLKLMDS